MNAIDLLHVQVALHKGEDAASFRFSRTWTEPRTVLHLAFGQLALANVTHLVVDDKLACEYLLLGLPVLHHLHLDTKILLRTTRAALDGADCSLRG